MNFCKNFFLFSPFLLSISIAMENSQLERVAITPPLLTYKIYVEELLEGNDIQGWGDLQDNLQPCLQNPANKKILKRYNKTALDNLNLFLVTLSPLVENNSFLRIDYCLPDPNLDLNDCMPTLSLFRLASEGEICLIRNEPSETPLEMVIRLNKWQDEYKKSLNESYFKNYFIPGIIQGVNGYCPPLLSNGVYKLKNVISKLGALKMYTVFSGLLMSGAIIYYTFLNDNLNKLNVTHMEMLDVCKYGKQNRYDFSIPIEDINEAEEICYRIANLYYLDAYGKLKFEKAFCSKSLIALNIANTVILSALYVGYPLYSSLKNFWRNLNPQYT